jgi:hypothetical protein
MGCQCMSSPIAGARRKSVGPDNCFVLLGTMLTAEFRPTSGETTLSGLSVRKKPGKTRRRIVCCPRFGAYFRKLEGQ